MNGIQLIAFKEALKAAHANIVMAEDVLSSDHELDQAIHVSLGEIKEVLTDLVDEGSLE